MLRPYPLEDTYINTRGGFIDYLLDRPDVAEVWKKFTHHDFVERMGDGTLPIEKFKFYMSQDYLYLVLQHQPSYMNVFANRSSYNSQEQTRWLATKPRHWKELQQ